MVTKRKKVLTVFFISLLAVCLTALAFLHLPTAAYASTATDGMWQNGQTQNLIPTLHEGNVREQGWNIDEPDAQVNAAERDGGWAILAANGNDDLGNSDYTGGVYYVIELSPADQAKARAGQLFISGSVRTWIQGASATHHLSIRAEFFNTSDISGTGFHTESATFAPERKVLPRTEEISMPKKSVPRDAVKIKMWFSNQGSLDGAPWLGSMACYLHDTTAPSFSQAVLDDSGVIDPDNDIAIAGNTVKYRIQFNEKVSIVENGSSVLSMNGQTFATSSAAEAVDNDDGTTSVVYSFTLSESNDSGTLSLSSVSGLKVKDEAGNEFTYSGSPSAESLAYYGTMSVASELTNIEIDGAATAKYGADYNATLIANTGYELPLSVEITVGGSLIAGGGYSYNRSDGKVTVYGSYIKGDIVIKASGMAKKSAVTFDRQGGSGGTDSVTAAYDGNMPDITAPSRTGYTFAGYYSETGGNGTEYYDETGKSVRNCDFDEPITLYAHWIANEYTITYNANIPTGASGSITGTTKDSEHIYDTASLLSANGYILQGWTFQGWAESANGDVVYTDRQEVENLTSEANGTVVLYAVWEPNNYTVRYDGNKPANASADITGNTDSSSHVYDTESPLTVNGYTLQGWTFLGWSDVKGGTVKYSDGTLVKNLTSANGGNVSLYAVWEENSYTVSFDTDGGGRAESVSAEYDNKLPNVIPPVRKGYNFAGYFTLPNGEGEQYYDANGEAYLGLTYTVDGGITLYACWTPIHYIIELYSSGKYVGVIDDVIYGQLRLPSAETLGIERENYDFIGWNLYDGQDWSMYSADTDYIAGLADTDGETVVLYAAWLEKERYTVSFDANGGTGAPALTEAHEGETIVLSGTIPVRENYTFLGWAVTADAEEAQYRAGGEFTMSNSVVTLYAVWKQNPSLSYDANGGAFSGTPGTSYPAAGGTVVISSIVPEREGYVFAGWSTVQSAESADYMPDAEFEMPETDVVFYAVWKNAQYTVTTTVPNGYEIVGLENQYYFEDTASFSVLGASPKVYINGELAYAGENEQYTFVVKGNTHVFVADGSKLSLIYSANGGTGAPVDNNVYDTDGMANVSESEPSRPGYTFTGWATDPDAIEAKYTSGSTITFNGEDIILYAVWKANTYTVNYAPNGGEGSMEPDSFIYGTEGNLSENTFSKEGHTFIGWATESGGEAIYADGETVSDLCAENNGGITLYAVWRKTVTVITFETEGGTSVNDPVSVAYGEVLSPTGLSVPVRGGYVFSGYYTERNDNGIMIFDAELNVAGDYLTKGWDMNVGALMLHPHWIPVSYTVIYMNGQEKLGEQSAVYGVPFNLTSADSLEIIAPEGKHFAGWTTAPSGQIALYADGQSVTDGLTQTDGGEVLLYAVFEADEKFTVSYNANGGSNAPVDVNKYLAGEKVIISEIIPEKEGYIFSGWSYDPNGEEIAFPYEDGKFETDSVTMPNGGITLYAVWTAGETLQSQIDALEKNAGELSAAIAALEKADGGLNTELDELGTALKAAQDAIDSLDDTFSTDAELTAAVTELKGLLTEAQESLTEKISQVQDNLDSAVSRLEGLIGGNSDDIEELKAALAAMETAYKNADAVINGKISGLESKDAELAESLSALEAAYKAADSALRESIDEIKNELESEVQRLEELIASNGGEIDGLEVALNNLETNSEIGALKDKDTELGESISELDSAYKAADAVLQQAIERLERELEEAVKSLSDSIAENKADIESKLAAAENAYAAADALIKSDIGLLKTELSDRISDLEQAYIAADKALQESIDGVESKLNAVTSGSGDISELEKAIADLNAAYKAADTLINSEIADLKNQDDAIRTSIAALESAYKTADEALWAGIREVQDNLDVLQAENDNASKIYMIINIALAGVAVVLIVTLIVKAVKRRKSEK